MKNKFHPPDYIPTEQEHKIAYLTHMLEDIFYDYLLCINMVRTGQMKDNTRKDIDGTESLIERNLKQIDKMFEKWRDEGKSELWELDYPYEKFKKDFSEYLKEEHCGDCICVPCTCMRCFAEYFYKLESTVTWCKSCEFYVNKSCDHSRLV